MGLQVSSFRFLVSDFELRVLGLWFRVLSFGFHISGFGFSGLRFWGNLVLTQPQLPQDHRSARVGLPALGFRVQTRKVDDRLPGKGTSNSHGARPVH